MSYTVYAKRLVPREPITDYRSKEIIDDGTNKTMLVWKNCLYKDTAERLAKSITSRQDKGVWEVWVENDEINK